MSISNPNDIDCPIFIFALEKYKEQNRGNPVDYDEFLEDYQRFWYIIKLLVIYRNSYELNIRLLFNHLTILSNNFGTTTAQILLRLVLDKGDYDVIRLAMTVLNFIGYIPDDKFMTIINEEYMLTDIPVDNDFIKFINKELDDANI